MLAARVLFAFVLSSVALACSGTAAGQDVLVAQPTEPAPSGTTPPSQCVPKTCPPDERTFTTVTACTNAGADRCAQLLTGCGGSTVYCGLFTPTCNGVPSCDPGDYQATSCDGGECYTRTACGTSILCKKQGVGCDVAPTCDAGDVTITQTQCNNSFNCYERTSCGATVYCMKAK
jgi:hypothetical protein